MFITLLFVHVVHAQDGVYSEWSGYAALEGRAFQHDPSDVRQHGDSLSFAIQPEYYREWNHGDSALLFVPFVRVDEDDGQRSHIDIRELNWVRVTRDREMRIGVGKVFWGVTESQHLVDIINQTDLVESFDGEEKLGQPMIRLGFVRDWGNLDLFVLPGFRERTFPGVHGRLRSVLPVDTDAARYASASRDTHIDFALRYFRSIGRWDIGLSHFSGTSREPRLVPGIDERGIPVLIPYYDTIDQSGLDVQYTRDAWLWKLELITRSGQGDRFSALTGGFEYTFFGVFDSAMDVGILAEYLFDDRHDHAGTPFENDLFLGMRLALNDIHGSQALIGVIRDLDDGAKIFSVEASRRFGEHWKLELEARLFSDVPRDDVLHGLRNDDFVELDLRYYF
jgi:hypothetical protein